MSTSNRALTTLFAAWSVSFLACDSPDLEVRSTPGVLTDLQTGRQVMLENGDGETLVTNLATGERMIVPGELAGTMTDDDFTEMLAARGDDGEVEFDLDLALAPGQHGTPYYAPFNFTSDAWLSSTSSKAGPSSITATVTAKTGSKTGTGITVELRRSILGNDVNYGKKDMWLTPSMSEPTKFTWPTGNIAGNYYIRIDKNGWNNSAKIEGGVSF